MASHFKLLTPVRIGPVVLKNRVVLAALHTNFAEAGDIGARARAFYERRARGGAGLVMVGVANSEPPRLQGTAYDFAGDEALPSYRALVEAVHAHGAKIGIQLTPLPYYGHPSLKPPADRLPGLIGHLAEAAHRAVRAGFDLVELMASGGSLAGHLLSPVHNSWKIPGYGRGPEERARFSLEALAAMRQAVGPERVLTIRMHGHEFLPEGYGVEQACLHARWFVEAGADGINLTGGGHQSAVPQITMEVPRGAYLYLARAVRQAVSVPVFASNRIGDPRLAEELLRRGDADLVNLPRSLLADPDLPEKTARGDLASIRPCIACCGCLDSILEGRMLQCTVNPEVSREHQPSVPSLAGGTRALVVGGGPAGCEAALTLSGRGARVTLLEASEHIGGKLEVARVPPGREEIASLIGYFRQALDRNGVELRLGEPATVEKAAAEHPDILVLACGSRPRRPTIEGIDLPQVVLAEEVLRGRADVGRRVVVIGGGGVGVETALFVAASWTVDPKTQAFLVRTRAASPEEAAGLALQGKPVTLCSRGLKLGRGIGRTTRWTLLRHLEQLGVRLVRGADYLRITERGLDLHHPDGREETIQADTVVVAAGFESDPQLLGRFARTADRVVVVGDARECGTLRGAIHDARRQAEAL